MQGRQLATQIYHGIFPGWTVKCSKYKERNKYSFGSCFEWSLDGSVNWLAVVQLGQMDGWIGEFIVRMIDSFWYMLID